MSENANADQMAMNIISANTEITLKNLYIPARVAVSRFIKRRRHKGRTSRTKIDDVDWGRTKRITTQCGYTNWKAHVAQMLTTCQSNFTWRRQ